jgi:hypothetical protein
MTPKEEYVIVNSEHYSSMVYGYYSESEKSQYGAYKSVANGVIRNVVYYYVPYGLCTTFNNIDDAITTANIILKELRKTNPRTILIIDERGEKGYYDGSALWVKKVPKSYYLGNYYAFLMSVKESGFKYANFERYQVARHRTDMEPEVKTYWEYLIVDENNQYFWTTDRFKASLLTYEEQERLVKQLNAIGKKQIPYLGHCQAQNLPCLFDEEPKFTKGDKVYTKNYETKSFVEHKVTDIMAFEDGYYYALSGRPYDQVWITEENFYEGNPITNEINVYSKQDVRVMQKDTNYKNWKVCV